MRTVKKVLLALAIIIAIPFLVALFVKKEYTIQREVTINRNKLEVFNYIKYLKNQDHYSKWVMTDPAMKKHFRGNDGTIGFVYAWAGNSQAGKGEQEITNIKEGERIDVEIRFEEPMESTAKTPLITKAVSEKETKVIWGMQGRNVYPLNFMNLFMDNMLGKDLETSLNTLKTILESEKLSAK